MRTTVEALERAGLRHQVKVLVGGAPVPRAWAQQMGADGYGPDAASAVDEAKELLGKES
jgi:5-methyltetrahydrofolate--homocysteine methyltransferase